MRKKLILMIITFLTFNCCILGIHAASMTLSASSMDVAVGTTVTIYPKVSDLAGKFSVSSSNSSVLSGGDTGWCDNSGCNFNNLPHVIFKATNPGSATITFSTVDVSIDNGSDGEAYSNSRSITINVVTKKSSGGGGSSVDINKTYSKDNNLKLLDVEGYDITPEFNKDTLEYKLDLDSDVTKINITATPNDENAKVKGAGEVNLSEGVNTINIVVTAENGNEKTYKLIVNVEDKNPIKVKIDKKEYTVVKRKDSLGTKDGYIEKEIKINKIKVPALYNEATKVTLVGLKDNKGNIGLYAYDSKTGKYSIYNEFKFDVMDLYVYEAPKAKYKETKIKIGDTKVVAYKIDGVDDYYLLYGTNMTTGYIGYYLYDSKENSVQRYNEEMLSKLMSEKNKYFTIVIVLSCVCFLCMAFMLIMINKGRKT